MAFPSTLEDLLEANTVAVRSGVKILLGSGPVGFWNGLGTLSWDGVDYLQNHLIQVQEPLYTTGTAASDFTIEMPESADFGITPDVLAQIEGEDYKNATVVVYDFYFDPNTRDLLHVEPMLYGFIDTVDHVFDSGQWKIVGNIETAAIDNHRDGYRAANHEDQQLVYPGDTFFEYAGIVKHEDFDIEFS